MIQAQKSMAISGGVRFIPILGDSGSGKTSAALELGTHLPDAKVVELPRDAVSDRTLLRDFVERNHKQSTHELLVVVIDQYEEKVPDAKDIPAQFVEAVALMDRGDLRKLPTLFVWLTTGAAFRDELVAATRRNRRVLLKSDLEIHGPELTDWPGIVEETFSFHNSNRPLADFDVLPGDIVEISQDDGIDTLGDALEAVGDRIGINLPSLPNLSKYLVVMLWPVTDGQRITRIQGFTDPREGYKLDWSSWYRQLAPDDQASLPLHAYNRARLYFDVRLVPIAAADIHKLCRNLDNEKEKLHKSYLERFQKTHFYSILAGTWDPATYAPLRERDNSQRAHDAHTWYEQVTTSPTKIGRRLARVLRTLGIQAKHEQDIKTRHSTVRADILVERPGNVRDKVIVELKAYSTDNTMPSSIRDAVRVTLKRHAQLAGFLGRQ